MQRGETVRSDSGYLDGHFARPFARTIMHHRTRMRWGRADEAAMRGHLEQADAPHASKARYDVRRRFVMVDLDNGASFAFPPQLAQGLSAAPEADLAEIEISPAGTGLYWPRLDVDPDVKALLAGVFGSRAWMRELAARGSRARTPAKSAAARIDGAKGGRCGACSTQRPPNDLIRAASPRTAAGSRPAAGVRRRSPGRPVRCARSARARRWPQPAHRPQAPRKRAPAWLAPRRA